MARSKEFDVDEALASALGVFWQKGYEATSMQDLVAAMGIQKASLYGTFGDKHSLYLNALRSYQQQGLAKLERELVTTKSPKVAVRELLFGVAEDVCGRGGRRGCFCVNANIEMAPHDAEVAELVREHSVAVEAAIARALRRAKANGELKRGADCGQLATFLYGVLVAVNVLGKQRAGRDRLLSLVHQGLAALND